MFDFFWHERQETWTDLYLNQYPFQIFSEESPNNGHTKNGHNNSHQEGKGAKVDFKCHGYRGLMSQK